MTGLVINRSVQCIGSGDPTDLFCYGHATITGTEAQMFRGFPTYKRERCRRCESHRKLYLRNIDLTGKSAAAFQAEARAMVRRGHAPDNATARQLMIESGLTKSYIRDEVFLPALNHPCPGWCGDMVDGGFVRFVIEHTGDLELDCRDPRFRISPENCGPLCSNCNPQKYDTPWPQFMERQHAIRVNLANVQPFRAPPVQGRFDFDVP